MEGIRIPLVVTRQKLGPGRPKRLQILRKARAIQRWLVRNPWIRPMCVFNYAAIRIQQFFRGYYIRKHGLNEIIQRRLMKKKAAKLKVKQNQQLDKYLTYLDTYKKYNSPKPLWLDGGYSAWCAVKIQSVFRMKRARKRYFLQKRLVCQVACIIIQTAWRNHHYAYDESPPTPKRILTPNLAAQIIQLKWRSYCNKRIYFYFAELIKNKLKGAPYDLLRSIIPNESDLLDKASGVHVRFRLGGSIFPPKVYFKIFTHRPLCDVNSFAPRDYTGEKSVDGSVKHNKLKAFNPNPKSTLKLTDTIKVGARYFDTVISTNNPHGTRDWYKRDEKNNWRAISSHLFENILTPPWFREVGYSSKPKPFHFSSLTRVKEIKLLRKKKKRDWLLKAYKLAQQGNNGDDYSGSGNNNNNNNNNNNQDTYENSHIHSNNNTFNHSANDLLIYTNGGVNSPKNANKKSPKHYNNSNNSVNSEYIAQLLSENAHVNPKNNNSVAHYQQNKQQNKQNIVEKQHDFILYDDSEVNSRVSTSNYGTTLPPILDNGGISGSLQNLSGSMNIFNQNNINNNVNITSTNRYSANTNPGNGNYSNNNSKPNTSGGSNYANLSTTAALSIELQHILAPVTNVSLNKPYVKKTPPVFGIAYSGSGDNGLGGYIDSYSSGVRGGHSDANKMFSKYKSVNNPSGINNHVAMNDVLGNELVDWSLALDFEEYADNWNSLGTSMPSDVDHKVMYHLASTQNKLLNEQFYGKK